MLHRLWKPWYVYRPTQLLRRALTAFCPPSPGYRQLATSWGVRLWADPTKVIGRNILLGGLYDLPVSEMLARLIRPGDTVIDVGANVGYTTLLASVAAGPGGRVISFEPHPDLFAILERNTAAGREQFHIAETVLHRAALGETAGTAELVVPPQFEKNDGVARIDPHGTPGPDRISVSMETIDEVLGDGTADVLKIDVEGFELQVLRGAARALVSRRIRHIVFEDYDIKHSEVVRYLEGLGFRIFSVGWSMRGLVVAPAEIGSLATGLDAPNFVASIDPEVVVELGRSRGWLVLSKRLTRRCA
jgi:FkbM family methyltransferase